MYNVNLSTFLVSTQAIFISNPLKAGIFLPTTMIYFLTSFIFTSSHQRLIISREQLPPALMTPV